MKSLKQYPGKHVSRRHFLKSSCAAVAFASLSGTVNVLGNTPRRNKMILSFYMDDTNPEIVKADAFGDFLKYCNTFGIKGESSLIPGYNGRSIIREQDANQRSYLKLAKQAHSMGIDSHMEIMTHSSLFDFKEGRIIENAIHEGLWLHEPGITTAEYENYFSSILAEGEKSDIRFTGLTWPGCGCDVCTKRYAELKKISPLHLNQAAFQALLNLSKEGRFRNRVLPVFYESSETEYGIFRRAADGKYGVYDLMPNTEDHFGIWENSPEHVDPDYYITEDGKSGIIIRHLENNAPYCMWYMHWQGVNPENGKGWEAFKTVTSRIRKHLFDKVVWMRPGDIVTSFHDADGWKFTDNL